MDVVLVPVVLEGLSVETPPGPIDILIGMDHPELLVHSEIRRGGTNEPYTLRTELGGVARRRVREEGPQAQVFGTYVRQNSKEEFTKGSVTTCQAVISIFISHVHTLLQNWLYPMFVSPVGPQSRSLACFYR